MHNGPTSTSLLKFSFPVKPPTMGAMEETLRMPMNGSTSITSLTKHALPIKPLATITELDAVLKLSARTASLTVDAGLRKEQRSMELMSSD
jgi:hypothetical protein